VILAAEVERVTGIPENVLAEAWEICDVQRYARHYKRRLAGGKGALLRLEKLD